MFKPLGAGASSYAVGFNAPIAALMDNVLK